MRHRARPIGRRLSLVVVVATLYGVLVAIPAAAHNLDRNTAQAAARQVAKKDCLNTAGCESYSAEPVRLLTFHKATGKIHVISHKNGVRFDCRKQVVLKLDRDSNRISYALSSRKCENLGPQRG